MTLSTGQLEELERLLKAATPGPWRALDKMPYLTRDATAAYPADQTGNVRVADFGNWSDKELRPYNGERWLADCRLTAAMHEALPALIAAAANRSTAGFGAEGVDQRGGEWGQTAPSDPNAVNGPGISDPDEAFIEAALSWYAGGPAGDDVSGAWKRIRARLAAPKAPTTPDLAVKDERLGWEPFMENMKRREAAALAEVERLKGSVKELVEAASVVETYRGHIAKGFCELRTDDDFKSCQALEALHRLSRALAALGGDNQAEGVG